MVRSVERHCADDSVSLSKSQMDLITSMEVASPLEMVLTLEAPQGDFAGAFALGTGSWLILRPRGLGAEEFARNPGAGLYEVASSRRREARRWS